MISLSPRKAVELAGCDSYCCSSEATVKVCILWTQQGATVGVLLYLEIKFPAF